MLENRSCVRNSYTKDKLPITQTNLYLKKFFKQTPQNPCQQTRFKQIRFEQNRFKQTRFKQTRFKQTRFKLTGFKQTRFKQTRFKQTRLKQIRFKQTRFKQTRFKQTRLKQNTFEHNDLSILQKNELGLFSMPPYFGINDSCNLRLMRYGTDRDKCF